MSEITPFEIGGTTVAPGEQKSLELPVARLFTGQTVALPVAVLHGISPGPRIWLSATLHGDELNGMEIIRQVLGHLDPTTLSGTLVAMPVVNVFGFLDQQRYLPDRRDLNRSFPGLRQGSLAARLAHLFMREVVNRCEFGIDFHTGSLHRANLPQLRAHLEDPETLRLTRAFAAPMVYEAPLVRGTLRAAARRQGVRYLLFEGGEPLRFNDDAITAGVAGTLRVLSALDMWQGTAPEPAGPTFLGRKTSWVRAQRSGVLRLSVRLGDQVEKGQIVGRIGVDFFSSESRPVKAPFTGLVIGHTKNPLVNQGDALAHLARGEWLSDDGNV